MKNRIAHAAKAIKSKSVAIGSTLMLAIATTPAFAQETSGVGATVKQAVEEYKAEALIAIMAMIIVMWTLKATGVLKPR